MGPCIRWCSLCSHLRSSYGCRFSIIDVRELEYRYSVVSSGMIMSTFVKICRVVQTLLGGQVYWLGIIRLILLIQKKRRLKPLCNYEIWELLPLELNIHIVYKL